MYYIIRKVHLVNNKPIYTPIGYVTSIEDENYIRTGEKIDILEKWIVNNISDLQNGTLTDADGFYQNNIDFLYVGYFRAKNIDGMGLSLITDLDNPES